MSRAVGRGPSRQAGGAGKQTELDIKWSVRVLISTDELVDFIVEMRHFCTRIIGVTFYPFIFVVVAIDVASLTCSLTHFFLTAPSGSSLVETCGIGN